MAQKRVSSRSADPSCGRFGGGAFGGGAQTGAAAAAFGAKPAGFGGFGAKPVVQAGSQVRKR
eukprot:COSAG06_NODE_3702_length_4995_cov_6.277165_1_plen_62_part_00